MFNEHYSVPKPYIVHGGLLLTSIRRCKIDRLAEGYKGAIDEIRGLIANTGFLGGKSEFLGPNKRALFSRNHVLPTTSQSCAKKIYPFPKWQTWNLSKNLHRRIFRLKILHRQFHLILTVLVRNNTKNEWKWKNLHHWQKFYTAASSDGIDKFHLCQMNISLLADLGCLKLMTSAMMVMMICRTLFSQTSNSSSSGSRWRTK